MKKSNHEMFNFGKSFFVNLCRSTFSKSTKRACYCFGLSQRDGVVTCHHQCQNCFNIVSSLCHHCVKLSQSCVKVVNVVSKYEGYEGKRDGEGTQMFG